MKNLFIKLGESPFFTALRILSQYFLLILPFNICIIKIISVFIFVYDENGFIIRGLSFYLCVFSLTFIFLLFFIIFLGYILNFIGIIYLKFSSSILVSVSYILQIQKKKIWIFFIVLWFFTVFFSNEFFICLINIYFLLFLTFFVNLLTVICYIFFRLFDLSFFYNIGLTSLISFEILNQNIIKSWFGISQKHMWLLNFLLSSFFNINFLLKLNINLGKDLSKFLDYDFISFNSFKFSFNTESYYLLGSCSRLTLALYNFLIFFFIYSS